MIKSRITYAPVCLFVFNRLEHTQKTVDALKKNILAPDSDLYIYSDAPKKIHQLLLQMMLEHILKPYLDLNQLLLKKEK